MKKALLGCAIAASMATNVMAAVLPNMVVFITDDQGYQDMSIVGNVDVQTPNMDILVEKGVSFKNAYVASPNSGPSRAAMLTGLVPSRNGAEPNQIGPDEEVARLPLLLKDLGYEVAAFGKVSHDDAADYSFDYHGSETQDGFFKGGIKHAVEFLENRKEGDKPVVIFVGTKAPHTPWPENERFDTNNLALKDKMVDTPLMRDFLARYYTAVEIADIKMGIVYDLAQEKLDNPIFIHTADNGPQFPFGKWDLYDDGTHVPMTVSWPGHVPQGAETDAMVSWLDLIPTLIELGGGDAPKGIDGKSFAHVVKDPTLDHRERVYSANSGDSGVNAYPIRSVQDKQYKLIWNLYPESRHDTHINLSAGPDGRPYWDEWLKVAKTDDKAMQLVQKYYYRPKYELYDLEADPNEMNNLADSPEYADMVAEMSKDIETKMKEQGDEGKLYPDPIGFKMKVMMKIAAFLMWEDDNPPARMNNIF